VHRKRLFPAPSISSQIKQVYLLSLKYDPLDVVADTRFYNHTPAIFINTFCLRIYISALIQIIQATLLVKASLTFLLPPLSIRSLVLSS
jgi:hypothetical protein